MDREERGYYQGITSLDNKRSIVKTLETEGYANCEWRLIMIVSLSLKL